MRNCFVVTQAAFWTVVATLAALFLIYRYPLGLGLAFPACWFYSLTGLHCPGCGATRALHALLQGEMGRAVDYNVLAVVLGPAVMAWSVFLLYRALRYRRVSPPAIPGHVLAGALLTAITFAVLRNLPFAPFPLLAP